MFCRLSSAETAKNISELAWSSFSFFHLNRLQSCHLSVQKNFLSRFFSRVSFLQHLRSPDSGYRAVHRWTGPQIGHHLRRLSIEFDHLIRMFILWFSLIYAGNQILLMAPIENRTSRKVLSDSPLKLNFDARRRCLLPACRSFSGNALFSEHSQLENIPNWRISTECSRMMGVPRRTSTVRLECHQAGLLVASEPCFQDGRADG